MLVSTAGILPISYLQVKERMAQLDAGPRFSEEDDEE